MTQVIRFDNEISQAKKNNKSLVQDGRRENDLRILFQLDEVEGRLTADAVDTFGNEYELKSTSKGSVSTARDFGLAHIERYRSRYMVVANFNNYSASGDYEFTSFYFLAPCHLDAWYEKTAERLRTSGEIMDRARVILAETMPEEEYVKVSHALTRGILLNDPVIPKNYVERNGIPITDNHAERLRELVAMYPMSA